MWEKLNSKDTYVGHVTERMAVPQGWIVRSTYISSSGIAIHQIFVEDPSHSWVVK
jgi:hypothetical protein